MADLKNTQHATEYDDVPDRERRGTTTSINLNNNVEAKYATHASPSPAMFPVVVARARDRC